MERADWRDFCKPGLYCADTGVLLLPSLRLACTPLARMRGLLGLHSLPEDTGLLLWPGNNIHMFFMRFAIDVVFLREDGMILKITAHVKPWRVAWCLRAAGVLELSAGSADRLALRVGQRLRITETDVKI